MVQPVYDLLKSYQPDIIQWNPEVKQAIESLQKELFKAFAFGHPNHKFPFFLFIHENK